MDGSRSFRSAEASGRIGTIDWDRGVCRERASEGSRAPVRKGTSGGHDFLEDFGDTREKFFGRFWVIRQYRGIWKGGDDRLGQGDPQ